MDPTLAINNLPLTGNDGQEGAEEPTAPTMAPASVEQGQPSVAMATSSAFDNVEPSAFENMEPDEDDSTEPAGPMATTTLEAVSSSVATHATPAEHARHLDTAPVSSAPVPSDKADTDLGLSVSQGAAATSSLDQHWQPSASDKAPVSPQEAPAAAPDADHRAPPSMKDLFGPFFLIEAVPEKAADPALLDTRSMLQTHFGPFVQEADVLLQNETDALALAMRANKEAREQARVQQLFGAAGPEVLRQEAQEAFTVLKSTLPSAPSQLLSKEVEGAAREEAPQPIPDKDRHVWLVEMPRMMPNRQTLHADPQPFFPTRCELLESDDRALYTPQNVLRWAYHEPTETYLSNARVVRWSDGSFTLHVGSDTYSLDNAKSNAAVHLLGSPTAVTKGAVTLPSITKTLNPGKHMVIESTEARSIERAVLAESAQHRTNAERMKLAYAQAPLPEVDWTKPNAARNPQEEYVAMEYERRTKELQRRFKEGRPMTLREQLEEDAQLFQQLSTANVEELLERQREERRQAALSAARRAHLSADGQRSGGRSRLDRDVGLAAFSSGDAGASDPFMTYDDEKADGEDTEHSVSGEDSADEDIEAMMDRMREKRLREEQEAGPKRPRTEADRSDKEKYAPLLAALEHALTTIPRDEEDVFGEVEGMIAYMRSADFSASVLPSEIPSLAKSVAERVPDADLSKVWEAFNSLPV